MKPFRPIMLSHFIKRSSVGLVKRTNGFQLATVRYQSNKIAPLDDLTTDEVAAKVTKQKKTDNFNAISNQNIKSQEQQSQKQQTSQGKTVKTVKKVKKDYTWLPRVPSTQFFSEEEIAFDKFVNQHRPLVLFDFESEEFKALEAEETNVWSLSINGEVLQNGWESLPAEDTENLIPFHPPPTPEALKLGEVNKTKQPVAKYFTVLDRKSRLDKLRKSKTRGRYKPSYNLDPPGRDEDDY